MFLVTGLGNPGKEYERTPHNAGFLFVNTFREYLKSKNTEVSDWKNEEKIFNSEVCKVKNQGELLGILQKPLTYMNLSGGAVKLIYSKFDINEYILVHDDLDIPLGKYKIQREKSPKGHRGVKSVEDSLGIIDFTRVRIGVDNRRDIDILGEEYVLIKYSEKEYENLKFVIQEGVEELVNLLFEL